MSSTNNDSLGQVNTPPMNIGPYSSGLVLLLFAALVVAFAVGAILAVALGGPSDVAYAVVIVIVGILVLLVLLAHTTYSIQPYETALVTVFGSYRGYLKSGFNLVSPVASVLRVDLRTQVQEIPRQEVITKDNSPTNVDAFIYIKVVDAMSALFRVVDYRQATVALAQTTLRSIIGDMELDQILYDRERINANLRDILDKETSKWGVKVEHVEIKEVDPVGPVKTAMEEQTAAERQRRATMLRADGEKRSAILVAEGQKRSRILQAEGVRQSKILEAEGSRLATILEAQGEAQRLRILAMGAAPLDAKALTVISLDTMGEMAQGASTKILFPFEMTKLMEGAAEYLGVGRTVPERGISNLDELEKKMGSADDVLGPIPRPSELSNEIRSIEDEIRAESAASEAVIRGKGGRDIPGEDTPPPPRRGTGSPPSETESTEDGDSTNA